MTYNRVIHPPSRYQELWDSSIGGVCDGQAALVVWMTRFAIKDLRDGSGNVAYQLYVRNDDRRPRLVKLVAVYGAQDMHAPEPAITVMMPDED